MTDPRQGLRRRFNGVDEILEAHGGQPRIQGLNYNALRTLRDPLYVKYAEQLRDESKAATQARLNYDEFAAMLRRYSSENDVPFDVARDIIESIPPTIPDDSNYMDYDDWGDFGGGGGGPPPPPGPPPPGVPLYPPVPPPPRPPPPPPDITRQETGSDEEMSPPGMTPPHDGRGGAPDPDGVPLFNETGHLFRSNLELHAQIAELREQIKKAARQQEAAAAIKAGAPREGPLREIIREIHQVQTPIPTQDPQLAGLLQQALSSNENMASIAQSMGMTMAQWVAWANGQMHRASAPTGAPASYRIYTPQPRPPPKAPQIAAVTRTLPPPLDAPSKKIRAEPEKAKATTVIPPEAPAPKAVAPTPVLAKPSTAPIRPSTAPKPKPSAAPPRPSAADIPVSRSRSGPRIQEDKPVPILERSRSAVKIPTPAVPTPPDRSVSRVPSRAASVATVDYGPGPKRVPSASVASAATVDYGPGPKRVPSASVTTPDSRPKPLYDRSRSRSAAQEIVDPVLPIREEVRGRSPPKMQKIMEHIAKSQSRELVKGQMRHEIGRFAQSFAAKRKERQAETRAPSVPAPPKTRTFDEIVALTDRGMEQTIKNKTVPFGAAKQKQRTSSLGDARVRFQGRPIAA